VIEGEPAEPAIPGIRRNASAAVLSQFLNAGGSFVLQIVAARTLGARGYGSFALCTATLILISAVHSAWIGDTLTVLDRFDLDIRRALVTSHIVSVAASALTAVVVGLSIGHLSARGTVVFAGLCAAWAIEETGRRVLGARLQFWQLVINDSIYVVVTLIVALGSRLVLHRFSLDAMLASMGVGAVAAVLADLVQLPAHERQIPKPGLTALRLVNAFAVWRAGQAGLRPLSLLVMRILVVAFASREALASVEASRLALAPVIAFVSGASSFLLPLFAVEERSERRSVSVRTATVLLVGAVVVYGAIIVAVSGQLSHFLAAGSFRIDRATVVSWTAFTAAFAFGLPSAAVLVARRRPRVVFVTRLVDSLLGTAVAAGFILAVHPGYAPAGMAIGMVVSGAVLYVMAVQPSTPEPEVAPC
jgi:O-antigen/teichoic acid export membrane protein